MSAVVKTLTPFTDQALLMESLDILNVGYNQGHTDTIVTNRKDFFGKQRFERDSNGCYRFRYDSDADRWQSSTQSPVRLFLAEVEQQYRLADQRRFELLAEAERQRLEQERIARVEATRLKTIERAKAQGYAVKEKRVNGNIQLVLTRTSY